MTLHTQKDDSENGNGAERENRVESSSVEGPRRISTNEDQWNVFCEHHCRFWFGFAKDWNGEGKLKDNYRVMHAFKPISLRLSSNENEFNKKPKIYNAVEHNNVYYYDDSRGTVTNGPHCGPWIINRSDSVESNLPTSPELAYSSPPPFAPQTLDFSKQLTLNIATGFQHHPESEPLPAPTSPAGVRHPVWPNTRSLYFSTGSGVLFNKSLSPYSDEQLGGQGACNKLILKHPEQDKIRQSVTIEYDGHYKLVQVKSYQESSEGWKTEYWTKETPIGKELPPTNKRLKSHETLDACLHVSLDKEDSSLLLHCPSSAAGGKSLLESCVATPEYTTFVISPNTMLSCPQNLKPGLAALMVLGWRVSEDIYQEIAACFDTRHKFKYSTLTMYSVQNCSA